MPAIAHRFAPMGVAHLILVFSMLLADSLLAQAESVAEIPVLAATSLNDQGVFEVLLLRWDHLPNPTPTVLQWKGGNIRPGQGNLSSMARAFQYAVNHTSHVEHVGIVSAIRNAYAATGSDGLSAGAVMTVGFAALFKGDRIWSGIALTGTIRNDGTIGPLRGIPEKIRAAVREGYHTILIPGGQCMIRNGILTDLGSQR